MLQFINKKDKGMRIARDGEQLLVNPHETYELQDGDCIAIISGVLVNVKWVPLCCYVQPVMGKSPVSLKACAALGIHIVHIPNSNVTHHFLPSYIAQPIVAASLLSACHFAKIEWLQEVIRLGTLPRGGDPAQGMSLETSFELPPLNKYRPTYSPTLPVSQKEFRVWEPNEERLRMLSEYRFLYVDEKARLGDLKEVIERGGGSFETFDATTGKSKFHRALSRGQAKEGKKQVIVGKAKSITAAIGKEAWKDLVEEAKSFGLHILDPDIIVQVVIDMDTSLFESPPPDMDVDEAGKSNSLPDFIPNTHSDEPSVAPPEPEQRSGPPRRLVRRATSRQASVEPSSIPASTMKTPEPIPAPVADSESVEVTRPRKALTRRVKTGGAPLVIGLDDPSVILDSTPAISAPTSPPPAPTPIVDLTAPTPLRTNRLKRRVGPNVSDTLASQSVGFSLGMDVPVDEPPLKKFKALFDASHPDNMGSGTFNEGAFEELPQIVNGSSSSQTQTQSQTQGSALRAGRMGTAANLSTLREEEEETQGTMLSRGRKRTLDDVQEDVEMDDASQVAGPSLAKKRAIENINSVEKAPPATKPPSSRAASKPPSSALAPVKSKPHKGGAAPGKPDQDANFLKAIASTKRGKKTEDEFDREFNKLKISKPALDREEPEEQWAVLADFGDDTNIRGNFMVVVEMQAYNRAKHKTGGQEVPQEWQGKPNFKKFKKQKVGVRKARVEVFLNQRDDYGMDSAWNEDKSQSTLRGDFGLTQTKAEVKRESTTQTLGRSQAPMVIDDDEDDDDMPVVRKSKGKAKASSRAGSAAPPTRTSSRSKVSAKKSQPLFLDDDDDDEIQVIDEDDEPMASDDEQTLRSTLPRATKPRTTRASKKPAPVLADGDSDDGVFKGFGKGTRKR
ncbi:hypothetical protein H0H81_009705 [Sphagnurus paluster]|uniref:Nibrin n=1 Tax=Sphagnurus paluster TaxID=117069 RepID=A0A9P7GST8_9AGAR|nr:hypothetical protein H0H81_009705 [Sphagnurus paluster]